VGRLTLPPGSMVYLDTNCIIYSVEQVPPYAAELLMLWQAATAGQCSLCTSGLTLTETLVAPLRAGNAVLADRYRRLLKESSDLQLVDVSLEVLERAAQLRADLGLRTPDAVHAASALVGNCTHLISNDPVFKRMHGLHVVVLNDLLAP
jgi:predicted nucleic acid-binding protein